MRLRYTHVCKYVYLYIYIRVGIYIQVHIYILIQQEKFQPDHVQTGCGFPGPGHGRECDKWVPTTPPETPALWMWNLEFRRLLVSDSEAHVGHLNQANSLKTTARSSLVVFFFFFLYTNNLLRTGPLTRYSASFTGILHLS
jgi:hypothetical protein